MISKWILRLDEHLQGAPEEYLTLALLGVAGVILLIAICGEPAHKAGALVWVCAP